MIKKYLRSGLILLFLCVGLSGCSSSGSTEAPSPDGTVKAADKGTASGPAGPDIDTFEYTGRYLRAKDGQDMIVIDGQGPVTVSDKSDTGQLFKDLDNGDLVKVELGLIKESYPGQSEAFSCTLVEKGRIEKIDGDTLKQLQEIGWLDEASLGKAEPKKMVFIDNKTFASTGREAYVTCGTADGQITSVTSESKAPQENGQANFNCKGTDYILVDEDGVAVLMEGKYILFLTEDAVDYEGRCYKKSSLSEETLEWLEFYNGLSPEDQLKISMVPREFVPEGDSTEVLETGEGK